MERRGHKFARYSDDFLVMVKIAKAAERVDSYLGQLRRENFKDWSDRWHVHGLADIARPIPPRDVQHTRNPATPIRHRYDQRTRILSRCLVAALSPRTNLPPIFRGFRKRVLATVGLYC